MSEKAILVACPRHENFRETLALCETAGLDVIEVVKFCKRPDSRYYLTKGKLEHLKEVLQEDSVDLVVIDAPLKPAQYYRLQSELGVNVIDRIMLILRIFELHSGSKEAKLQTELAKLKYELALAKEYVKRKKLGEQVHFLGPGEYAAEYLIKAFKRKIKKIERELEKVKKRRISQKLARRKALNLPEIAITGYTCAGKTALVNAISRLSLREGREMFTTITPKHVKVEYGNWEAILIDTVGFIESVPPQLIEAFHATLAEVTYSDAVVLVVDASESPSRVLDKTMSSLEVLSEINAIDKPLVVALNKIDLASDWHVKKELVEELLKEYYPWSFSIVPVSAKTRTNLYLLLEELREATKERVPPIEWS